VYKFLEEQGVRPEFAETEKLSDFNAIKFYHITHAQPEYEMIDTINLADVFFGYKASSAIDNWERLRDPPFPIDDSRSKYDYSKLNWARPGGTPLSQQVASVPDYDWAKTTMWD
jgi:hypothetical protein